VNVLLVNPPTGTRYPQPPLGLLSIAGALEAHKHRVAIVDGNIEELWMGLVRGKAKVADVVGVTVNSLGYRQAVGVIEMLKSVRPDVPVIVGGPHASALPVETWEGTGCDCVVEGEGEAAMVEMLGGKPLPVGVVGRGPRLEMDRLPMPAYYLVDHRRYRPHAPHGRRRPFMPLVTSRGCPYRCAFCSKSVFGSSYRFQSPARTLEELRFLKQMYRIREVAFYDDTFTLNRNRVMELCELLERSGLDIEWSCETRVDLVDPELLGAMRAGGGRSIAYGIESVNWDTLKHINKETAVDQAIQAVRRTKQAGIDVVGYFMFVPERETLEDMQRTVDLAISLAPDYVQFAVLTPLPGSALYAGDGWLSHNRESYSGLTGQGGDGVGWAYRKFYLRPRYLLSRGLRLLRSPSELRMLVQGVLMLARVGK